MKTKILYYAKEIVIFIVTMTILANLISIYKSGDLKKDSFNMTNIELLDNRVYQQQSDSPLLVHFWATWCPTCSVEASNIQRISEDYEVITIAVKSNKEEIIKYLKDKELDFNVVDDNDGSIAREYNIAAYPTTFIYDKDKNLIFSDVGYTSTFGLWLRMWWASI